MKARGIEHICVTVNSLFPSAKMVGIERLFTEEAVKKHPILFSLELVYNELEVLNFKDESLNLSIDLKGFQLLRIDGVSTESDQKLRDALSIARLLNSDEDFVKITHGLSTSSINKLVREFPSQIVEVRDMVILGSLYADREFDCVVFLHNDCVVYRRVSYRNKAKMYPLFKRRLT